jgi:Tol biopolymer transport system component
LNPAVPAELDRIIGKALEKDRDVRYQSAAELRADLKRLKRDLDSGRVGAVTATAAVAAPPTRAGRGRWLWSGVAVAAALLLVGVVQWQFFGPPHGQTTQAPGGEPSPEPAPPPLLQVNLTHHAGQEYQPSFSPDDKWIAYVWDGEGRDNFDVYVELIGTGVPQQLTRSPADDFSPVWRPPDGRQIAFARFDREKRTGGIYLIDAVRDARERPLCPQGLPGRHAASFAATDMVCSLSWFPDGKTLAFPSQEAADKPVGIFLLDVDAAGAVPQRLTTPPAEAICDILPAFSPDGRTLAFVRVTSHYVHDIYVVSLADGRPVGAPRPLTHDKVPIAGLAWTPDGRIVFSSPRGGGDIFSLRLWRVAVARGEPELLPVGEDAGDVAVSHRGHRLAYVKGPPDTHMFRIKKPPTPNDRPVPIPFAPSGRFETNPRYSPDGQRVAFASNRKDGLEIWACDGEGRDAVQLTSLGTSGSPSWSHDSKSVVFDSRASGRAAIYVVDADDRKVRQITTGREDIVPSWSRNGEWVYFSSNARGGGEGDQLYRVRPQGGQDVELTQLTRKQGGLNPVESTDGKWVYYYSRTAQAIWKVRPEGGEESEVLRREGTGLGDWTLAKDGIYYLAPDAPVGPTFRFLNFTTGESVDVARLDRRPFEDVRQCRVSPNGEWILYSVLRYPRDIMLVENFR